MIYFMELRSYCLKVTYNPFTMFIQKSKLILGRPQIKSNNRAIYIYIYKKLNKIFYG